MTTPAFLEAFAEQHRSAEAEMRAAVIDGDDERRALALGRLTDLHDILSRTFDSATVEATP